MAIFKCKMCGGDLTVAEGVTVAECEYCGTKQTVPSADDEKKIALFSRANRLRLSCEFDKAAGIYETIVAEFPEEAEAYWGLILCKYGIEYVDDPKTLKKIPTCHRSSFDSVMDDKDFEMVMEYADTLARAVYREEAKAIETLRRGILDVSSKEEPYDIFICYKETDEKGDRTLDSVIAQDVYTALTEKGYRVFFSRITLEDKLGTAYEPYIFAALHSAKIMLAFGTDYEHFHAVWVKNEWSRFLQLIEKGEKKTLIPCYKGIDAYDMPKEFARLQAQDMGKVGAIQDLLRGIEKILPRTNTAPASAAGETILSPMLKRIYIMLEDRDWDKADALCEQALNIDPEHAETYLCKLLAKCKVSKLEDLCESSVPFESDPNYGKILRYGDDTLRKQLADVLEHIRERHEKERQESVYLQAVQQMNTSRTEEDFARAAELFCSVPTFRDAAALATQCAEHIETLREEKRRAEAEELHRKRASYDAAIACMQSAKGKTDFIKAADMFAKDLHFLDASQQHKRCLELAEESQKKDETYNRARGLMRGEDIHDYRQAIALFQSINGWYDADKQIENCQKRIAELKEQASAREKRLHEIRAEMEATTKHRKRLLVIVAPIASFAVFLLLLICIVIVPNTANKKAYEAALDAMHAQDFTKAANMFDNLGEYKDSVMKVKECQYRQALQYYTAGNIDAANAIFRKLNGYKDSEDLIHTHRYEEVESQNATCTEEGYTLLVCADCEDKIRNTVPKINHTYVFLREEEKHIVYECTVCGHHRFADKKE